MLFSKTLSPKMPLNLMGVLCMEYLICSTKIRYIGEQLMMLSRFGDIWIGCTYIYTSELSGSCSEEVPLFRGALPRSLYVTA